MKKPIVERPACLSFGAIAGATVIRCALVSDRGATLLLGCIRLPPSTERKLAPLKANFDDLLIHQLRSFNHVLHLLLAIALVVASFMVIWQFGTEVVDAVKTGHLAQGFLHSLGTLFIAWTLSSLISAEINYVLTGVFHLLVFVEVAMITLLRQLIIEPVQMVTVPLDSQQQFNPWHYGLLLAALLIVGVLHRLVRVTRTDRCVDRPYSPLEPQSHGPARNP